MASPADQLKQLALSQIEPIETMFAKFDSQKQYDDFSGDGTKTQDVAHFNSLCLAVVERIVGKEHPYYTEMRVIIGRHTISHPVAVPQMYGVIVSLKHDINSGFLVRFSEVEHANLFADFFEMGDHLLEQGYKDAAAVIIGGVLESHLKQLAMKHGIPLSDQNAQGVDVPRKAERLNSELARSVYGKLDQKNVTVWLDLRNKAAHAQYVDYAKEQVALFSQGLKFFMTSYPA